MAAPPDVIMIQETHMEETPKLPGYHRTSNTGAAQGVCTFVRKGITLIKLDRFLDGNTALELCATEVVVRRRKSPNPQHRSQRFRTLFQKARRKAEIAPTIDDLEKWTRSLVDAVARVSTEVETDESIPTMDPRLAHLIEARQSLQRRWKRMRHNRTLRKRIAHLGREIENTARSSAAESYWEEAPKWEEVSKQVARRLVVLPIPRNVHPDRNKERRVARARALAETYADDAKAVYVDAAKHQRKPKTYVAAVVRATDGKVLNACSVRATSAEQAEEAAIALALSGIPEATTILSDSRTAIANFGRESVGTPAASLLPRTKSTTTHLRWFPAHVGVIPGGAANRNEEADVVARVLAYPDEADFLDPDPLLDYGGILAWYREGHRALPGPHPRLGRREGLLLRQLQTGTVLTPALARHVCPGLFESATCSVWARELATLAHVLWGCDACAGGTVRDSLPPDMEHYISSPDHQAQLQAIQRLDAALARQKRTEVTPSS
ncbi:hypothetical protein HPB49_004032 [Dermacentor silvarum]|uniref:Uncharacterized protein n=1 Tax=Dermacentor silvarum TaxID=543639 RepID=A0ACB8DUD5_DERSI|nr:hypothetical protein HPB49_004032 [Dermacentor silvarum]